MSRAWRAPTLGVVAAITVTSALDANGLGDFGSLALAPLLLVAALWRRFSRRELGFTLARGADYVLAIGFPFLVIGVACAAAVLAGAANLDAFDPVAALREFAILALATTLVALVTEEGFFRGWLWAALERAGASERGRIALTTGAFVAWHIPVITFDTGFDLPARQIPVYLANATLIGVAWGLMRALSGSVIVTSVSHGIWNGLAYTLFAFGEKTGALGVENTALFGPEVGVLGILWNSLALVALIWRRWSAAERA